MMTSLTLRLVVGRELTLAEGDANFMALRATADAALAGFYTAPYSGAELTTLATIADDFVSIFRFMTPEQIADVKARTHSLDHSASMADALATGKTVHLYEGDYMAHGLTMPTFSQRLVAHGDVRIFKNGDGEILTISGQECEVNGVLFKGDDPAPVYTGHNIHVTTAGQNCRLINCGSIDAYGRALLAESGSLLIDGTNGNWRTADTSGTGYDIEIGVSGTATLYHHIRGVYTARSTGGIKLIDTGAASITESQIGKLYVANGTGPAGTTGPSVSDCRINGAVTVEVSGTLFTGNKFAGNVTFALGTSGCSLDESNAFDGGADITNNGNSSQTIRKNIGGSGTQITRFGDSASVATIEVDKTGIVWWHGSYHILDNGKSYMIRNGANDAYLALVALNSSNNCTLGHAVGAAYTSLNGGTGGVYLAVGGASKWEFTSAGQALPVTDIAQRIGSSSRRLLEIYCSNNVINTSDAREKVDIQDSPLGLSFILRLRPVSYRWLVSGNTVEVVEPMDPETGTPEVLRITPQAGTRPHYGFLAQEVKSAVDAENVGDFAGWTLDDPSDPESRQGLRYDQLEAPMVRAIQELHARIVALEGR